MMMVDSWARFDISFFCKRALRGKSDYFQVGTIQVVIIHNRLQFGAVTTIVITLFIGHSMSGFCCEREICHSSRVVKEPHTSVVKEKTRLVWFSFTTETAPQLSQQK